MLFAGNRSAYREAAERTVLTAITIGARPSALTITPPGVGRRECRSRNSRAKGGSS
jgi:hypothetical protein